MWRELVRPAILQARFANIPESTGFSRGEYVNIGYVPETKNVSLEKIEQNLMSGEKLRHIGC